MAEGLPLRGAPFPFGFTYVAPELFRPALARAEAPADALTEACVALRASFAFVPSEMSWAEDAVSALDEEGVAALWAMSGPLWSVIEKHGTVEGLRATLTRPEEIGAEIEQQLDGLLFEIGRAARLEVRAIVLAEDLAGSKGPLVAPDFAIAELMPRYERLVSTARALGMPAVFHSDGDIRLLLPAIARAGFVAVHAGGGLTFPAFDRLFWAARDVGLAVVGGLLTSELGNAARAEALGSTLGVLAKAGGLFVADDGGITSSGEVADLVTALEAARSA